MYKHALLFFPVGILLLLTACSSDTRFTNLSSSKTGIDFQNSLVEDTTFNFLNYLYFYNGGGVAAGDINNDGLDDLFFTSNQNENKLYLNKGDFKFEDFTESAGIVHQAGSWSTGVSMADLNGDGWLDIYVSNVNYLSRTGRNQLYINNGDGSFSEKAEAYGLDFEGYSVQSAYLDYDKDGDLDVFLLNHSIHSIGSYAPVNSRNNLDPKSGDILFRNDGNVFTDVSSEAGIFQSALGFGLGVTISDINNDGWPDIYVGNDFHEDDYLYINQKDGTFQESIRESVRHTSQFTMSVDIADINNDGLLEIATTDMLPFDETILKKSGGGDTYQVEQIKKNYGYYPQYSRNMLQFNRGLTSDKTPLFSEIGYLAGIEATDWSWSGLLADLNNDGYRDFYIANGIFRRPNDLDYIKYISSVDVQSSLAQGIDPENLKLIQRMPQLKIPNAVFENNTDLTFTDLSAEWGLDDESYSNGAVHTDLDNDGDLDVVVNNVNQPAFVYQNETNNNEQVRNFLQFHLMGEAKNTSGIGAKILVYAGEHSFIIEQSPVKGFQSSTSHVLHLGLGEIDLIDSLRIIWPDDRTELKTDLTVNTLLHLDQVFARNKYDYEKSSETETYFTDITSETGIDFKHEENFFVDFNSERLIPHYMSTLGPPLAVADVNNDGLEDFFVGNAMQHTGEIWVQQANATFKKIEIAEFNEDRYNEDTDAIFFNANGDEFPDLLVSSGGGQILGQYRELLDRLYINDGTGNFFFSNGLPPLYANSSTVVNGDFDGDGDEDLFIAGLSVPGYYGYNPVSFLLQNDGAGNFIDITDIVAPELRNVGMVTDAAWFDFDLDNDLDLAIVGEWMPITIFENILTQVVNDDSISTIFNNVTNDVGLENTQGWWNTVEVNDIDKDGDLDLLAGNLGLNSYFKATESEPIQLILNDFNQDQKIDPILTQTVNQQEFPIALVDELISQMTEMKKTFPTYKEIAGKSVQEIFSNEVLNKSARKKAVYFETSVFKNNNGLFDAIKLPAEAQFSSIYDIFIDDFNDDARPDIFLNGNFYGLSPFFGRNDASYGTILIQKEDGSFFAEPLDKNGVALTGEIRKLREIQLSDGNKAILISQNDGELSIIKNNRP